MSEPRDAAGAASSAQVGDVRLAYRSEGPDDAPVVVFSNSLGANLDMWEPQARALSGRFRVVRYDTRGHGRSDVPPGPYTLDQLGGDLLGLMDALGIARARICGLSLGGMTAQWLAIHHPERVERAIFADTAARIGSEQLWDERIADVRAGGMRAIREAGLARFFSEPFRLREPEFTRRIGDMLEATSPEGYMAACAALREADLRPLVGGIRTPVLVITGARDVATPVEQARELHAAIAGSELVILPEAAHLANLEQPEAFTSHVLAFFSTP